jgi:hypothetical protein
MKALTLIAAGLVSGCTALESRETQAWLALHAVDTIQTFDAAREPNCYEEGDSLTRSLIGRHPSDAEVAAWSVGMAGLHLGVTELLLRNDHPKLARAWQYVRIGITVDAVARNHSIGIRIGAPNKHRYPCETVTDQPPAQPAPPRPFG